MAETFLANRNNMTYPEMTGDDVFDSHRHCCVIVSLSTSKIRVREKNHHCEIVIREFGKGLSTALFIALEGFSQHFLCTELCQDESDYCGRQHGIN